MAVNIYDVAERAGVCVVTVSRVLNGVASVRDSNRQKVMRAMEELGYTPSAAARTLARGNSGVIGLLVPSLADFFMAEVVTGAEEAARRRGLFLMLAVTGLEEREVANAAQMHSEGRVDGMLVLAPASKTLVPRLVRNGVPMVLLDQNPPAKGINSITIDNFQVGYMAARHLIEGGHRRIGHLSGTAIYQSARDRAKGFKQALEDAGLSWEGLVRPCYYSQAAGYQAAREWLAEENRPSAIFAADDQIALGVFHAANELGLQVPDDLSLVGVDDSPPCRYVGRGMTTVRQPMREMGALGVHLLGRMLAREETDETVRVLEPELVVRGSTGCRKG